MMNNMEGLPGDPITLVVKAPNQKLGDQTIECFLDWTVKRLKTHLAAVYPNKPTEKNQRIIYSGKLLQDNVILRDVLRQHDDTRQHTVHLVCSSLADEPCSSFPATSSNKPSSHSSSSEPNTSTPGLRRSSTSAALHNNNPSSNNDGLRHRMHHSVSYPNFYQYGYPANYPMQYGHGQGHGQGQGYVQNAQQAYWMQQMYAQQMAQYMQYSTQYTTASMLHTNVPPPATPPAVPQPPANHNIAAPPVVNQAPVPPAPNPAPANQNMRMNAGVGAAVDDDEQEGGNRDWLDWIYTFCRMGVLLSIVYFYSSLNRFLVVISAMVFIYLYQGGWFQLQRGRPGVREGQEAAPEDQQPAEEGDEAQQGEDQPNTNPDDTDATDNAEDAETEETTEDDTNNDNDDAAPAEPPPPGVLATAWVFVSTFFTSLLPMDPANMAN